MRRAVWAGVGGCLLVGGVLVAATPGEVVGSAVPAPASTPGAPVPCAKGPAVLDRCFPGIDLGTATRRLEGIGMSCRREPPDTRCATGGDDHGVTAEITESLDVQGGITRVQVTASEGGLDVTPGAERRMRDLLDLGVHKVLPVFFPDRRALAREMIDTGLGMVDTCPPAGAEPTVTGYRVGCRNPWFIVIEGPAGVATDVTASVTVSTW